MHICRLTPVDAVAFQELRLAALKECPTDFGSSFEEECDFSQAFIEDRLAAGPDRGSFGAFEGAELVGLIALGRERPRKLEHKELIWGIYVTPTARGNGVGRALLLAALELVRSVPGIRQVNLSVNANNSVAIALYKSVGFEIFGHERGAMLVDGKLHDELHMCLHLTK